MCVLDVGNCAAPGTACVVQRDGEYFAAPSGNACSLDGNDGAVCKSGVCTLCGNAKVEAGEQCDDGFANVDERDGCTTRCEAAVCGDGVVTALAEQCDDKNENDNDACSKCQRVQWSADIAFGLGPRRDGLATSTLAGMNAIAASRYGEIYVGVMEGYRTKATAGVTAANSSGVIWQISETSDALIRLAGSGAPALVPHTESMVARYTGLGSIGGVATDRGGTVYFTEHGKYNYVMRIDAQGLLHIVAGTGENCIVDAEGCLTDEPGCPVEQTTCGNSAGNVDRLARSASLIGPGPLAFDQSGNLYFVDGNTIRVIDQDGVIRLHAGANSACGFGQVCGDGVPAVGARLGAVTGLVVDANNTLYLADSYPSNSQVPDTRGAIRKVADTQISNVETSTVELTAIAVLGDGTIAYATDASAYLFDGTDSVRFASGLALVGLTAESSGGALLLDTGHRTVERRDAAGSIETIFGSSRATDVFPGIRGTGVESRTRAVAIRDSGEVLFSTGPQLLSWDPRTGLVDFIAGRVSGECRVEGRGDEVCFQMITDIAIADGKVYVLDRGNEDTPESLRTDTEARNQVRVIAEGFVSLVAGKGGYCGRGCAEDIDSIADARDLVFVDVLGLDVRDGYAYVTTVERLWRIDLTTHAGTVVSTDGLCAEDVAITSSGIYVSDSWHCRIARLEGESLTTVSIVDAVCNPSGGGPPSGPCPGGGICGYPGKLTVRGDTVTYARPACDQVWTVKTDGTGATQLTGPGALDTENQPLAATKLAQPGVAVGSDDRLMVYDLGGRVRKVGPPPERTTETVIGNVDLSFTGSFAKTELGVVRQGVAFTPGNALLFDAARGVLRQVDLVAEQVYPVMGYAQPSGLGLSTSASVPSRYVAPLSGVRNRGGGVAFDAVRSVMYATSADGIIVTDVVGSDARQWMSRLLDIAPLLPPGAPFKPSDIELNEIALDPSGTHLYVCDGNANVIYSVPLVQSDAREHIEIIAGRRNFIGDRDAEAGVDALFNAPSGIAVSAHGGIYVADQMNNRVRRIEPNGKHAVSTIFGTGVASSVGDGAPASAMPVDQPLGVAFDAFNNLVVTGHDAVRVVLATGTTEADEPSATSTAATIYRAEEHASQVDLMTCLKAPFRGTADNELYVGDSCTGAVLRLRRQ